MAGVAVVVFVLHWGGFLGGTPALMDPHVNALRAAGVNAVALDYPLTTPLAEERWVARRVREAKRDGKRVIVWGTSAGGTLAASVAQRGIADAGVATAPVADLTSWSLDYPLGSAAERRAASPMYQSCQRKSPMLLVHATDDTITSFVDTRRYARRCGIRLSVRRTGGHVQAAWAQPSVVRWIVRRARELRCQTREC